MASKRMNNTVRQPYDAEEQHEKKQGFYLSRTLSRDCDHRNSGCVAAPGGAGRS